MRQWRVGTFSMGASLILLGLVLFFTQIKGLDMTSLFLSWWPFILIVLGIEILIYLFLAKQENTHVKYDFLSIIFIGVLGTVALSFMLLSFSGVLEEIRHAVSAKEQTYDLPSYIESVPNHIERVVLDTEDQPIQLEGATGQSVQVFGTYRTAQGELNEPLISSVEDYISIHESGDTLYVKIKKLPEKLGFFYEQSYADMVVLIPVHAKLEVRGDRGGRSITIRPGELQTDWLVHEAGYVNIQLNKESDVKVTAHTYEQENDEEKEKTWTTGDGKYLLNIASSHDVNVTIQ